MINLEKNISLGKMAVLLVVVTGEAEAAMQKQGKEFGYTLCKGKVGSMDSAKIFAAVETAAKKEGLVDQRYREEHALYHSVLEAYNGMCRGQDGLGTILRSAGLLFSIVRGNKLPGNTSDGEWIAVALYGNMGAPIKGYEHEVLGLGMNPI
ncbi:HutP family protein [Sporomusa acidovorans]|uniref:Hut operon positive regulatory protein n=1 Tax=Sporomusa acidovorans (strain ATCC 49682 / DSM 3132 / Mol) TaxID=1123286 RepID=A0ABZ3J982_SPOA4|nr:HutP family protein [Sporomusa acidovorans]OZC16090.1 Hut operon positive regulatory protein [Sporomusa acidovorans DSM 3132]SDD86967.1 hut operon positive regulatory protein [Sporomusa acidovorans]